MQSRACLIIESACDCIATRIASLLWLYTGVILLYTIYHTNPIVVRALGLYAECAREQKYHIYKGCMGSDSDIRFSSYKAVIKLFVIYM